MNIRTRVSNLESELRRISGIIEEKIPIPCYHCGVVHTKVQMTEIGLGFSWDTGWKKGYVCKDCIKLEQYDRREVMKETVMGKGRPPPKSKGKKKGKKKKQ